MHTVRIIQPWIPEYRRPFFDQLISSALRDDISIEVYGGAPPYNARKRNDEVRKFEFLKTYELKLLSRSVLFHKVDKSWKEVDLVIAEQAIRNLENYFFLYHKKNKVAFWGHGKTITKKKTKIEQNLSQTLVLKSDWFFGYTKQSVDFVIRKGFNEQRTTVVMNSIDTKEIQKNISRIDSELVSNYLNELNLDPGINLVFIGALDSSKRLEFLFETILRIRSVIQDVNLLIYGDGPELDYVLHFAKEHTFVKYCGRADSLRKALISKFATLLLNPGRVGLIAVDSFAMELPIVTTSWAWHGPEFEYLVNDYNSVITPNCTTDFVNAVVEILRNEKLYRKLQEGCRESREAFSIENMVANFISGIKNVLSIAI